MPTSFLMRRAPLTGLASGHARPRAAHRRSHRMRSTWWRALRPSLRAAPVVIACLLACAAPAHAEPSLANGLGEAEHGFVKLYTGGAHSMGIKADGTVWAWGRNTYGGLGVGDVTNRTAPTQVAALTGARSLALGEHHSMALMADGTVWSWGYNWYGQLGLGDTTDRSIPTQVTSLTGARSIVVGESHSMAILADGTVWAWGYNGFGQLGLGDTTNRTAPTQVTGLTGARSLALGEIHSAALKADGTVWTWGRNYLGQLGLGDTTDRSTPTQVTGMTGARSLTVGGRHAMVIMGDGTVWTWGYNGYGQLGLGDTTTRTSPTQVTALTGARALSHGWAHSMAIMADGTVWAWGSNGSGRLGLGDTTSRSVPTQVTTLTGARTLSLGFAYSTAITADGTASAWGDNTSGQLGVGDTTARTSPTQTLFECGCGFVKVYAGNNYTMAIKVDGTVWAWGDNFEGSLGLGDITQRRIPTQVTALTGARQLALGGGHSMAIKSDGTVWAWGNNYYGQLGLGDTTDRTSPTQVTALTGSRQLVLGSASSMAIKADGTVWSWGRNLYGELGLGDVTSRSTPTQVTGLTGSRRLGFGSSHAMAIKADGTVWSWGRNADGELGLGDTMDRTTPTQVTALTGSRQLALGQSHSSAIKADGTVWAWGRNLDGRLGLGDTTNRSTPTQVTALTGSRRLALGANYSMAIKADGTAWAWGTNSSGQLGQGDTTNRSTPTQVPALTGIRQLALGMYFSMSMKADGTVWALGSNSSGQLGQGDTTDRSTPVAVDGGCAAPPATPSNTAPMVGTTSALPTLTSSAYSDPNGDAHAASQWQVRTDSGTYATPFADSGESTTALTSWTLSTSLTAGTKYWFQVRYKDATGLWSAYSTETAFVYDPNAPLVPTLVSPGDGAAVTSAELVATYLDASPPSDGRVEFQMCTTSVCDVVLETGLSAYVTSGVDATWSHGQASGSYWWRARSVDSAGSVSAWSTARSFSFNRPPAAPTLVSPAAGAWVTTTSPTLTASYSDPDTDAGRNAFELCRADAADPWSSSCTSGYQLTTSASGASGVDKSAQPTTVLGQGDWYWRARSTDAGGGTSAWSGSRLLRVDSLPPTRPANVLIARSGLGKIRISWDASTDSGIGGVNYDVDWSTDGSTWSSVCADVTLLACEQSGLGGSSLPFIRVRACDALGNCTSWQGRVGGSASGYYLRTGIESTPLTGTTDKRATLASGTANQNTAQRVDSGEVGWMQLQPAALSTLNPTASEPAGTPSGNYGWLIEETAGATLAAGGWAVTVTTDSDNDGVARIQCRAWIVTVTAGAISASGNYQSAYTNSADVYQPGQQTHSCQLAGLAAQTTLAADQYVYVELYLHATTGGSTMNKRLYVVAEGTGSAISIPPPGTPPSTPTVTSQALSDATADLVGTYAHPTGAQGAIEYEYATDVGFTNVLQTGSSALLASGTSTTMTSEPMPPGTYYWRARARDTASLVSSWATGSVTVSTAPDTPTNSDPSAGGSTSDTTPTLTASAFSDVDTALGDTHTSSQFQIAVAGDDWSLGQDSGTITATTTWTVPTALTTGTTYQWRVRYLDAHGTWSAWSPVTTFTATTSAGTTIALDTTGIDMGLQTPGIDDFATAIVTVTTTNASGYQLVAAGTATGSDASACGACPTPFADWTGTGATPSPWPAGTGGYGGITIRDATGGRDTKWGAGTATVENDTVNNNYAGLPTSSILLHESPSATAGDSITLTWRLTAAMGTSATTHTETVSLSAVAKP